MNDLAELPASFLERIIASGLTDPAAIGKLVELQERIERMHAQSAYTVAMNAAQKEMPRVLRSKINTQTGSKYAPLEDVLKDVVPIYTKHGFSVSFGEGTPGAAGSVKIVCDVMHTSGHSVRYELEGGLDTSGIKGSTNKTDIQGKGSSVSYLRRYMLCMVFNVAIGDSDTDGNAAVPTVTPEEFDGLNGFFRKLEPETQERVLAWMSEASKSEVKELGQCPRKLYKQALSFLQRKTANHKQEQVP
jgi:hypothetical protein